MKNGVMSFCIKFDGYPAVIIDNSRGILNIFVVCVIIIR